VEEKQTHTGNTKYKTQAGGSKQKSIEEQSTVKCNIKLQVTEGTS
jgi:hypothetical protein